MILLVLHDFLVEVDLWDGHDHFALPLLDICIAGCSLLLYCVSSSYSALSLSQSFGLTLLVVGCSSSSVLAVGCALVLACRWLCLLS